MNNKGADQPAQPRSLISTFVVHSLDSKIPVLAISKISRLELVSEAEQATLCLTSSEIPKTGFLVTWLLSYIMKKNSYCFNKLLPVSSYSEIFNMQHHWLGVLYSLSQSI